MKPLLYFFKRKKAPQNFKPVILVTGCSSGIGLALAKLLHEHTEYRVVVTAREKSLHKVRKFFLDDDRFVVKSLDVTDEKDRLRLYGEIQRLWEALIF